MAAPHAQLIQKISASGARVAEVEDFVDFSPSAISTPMATRPRRRRRTI